MDVNSAFMVRDLIIALGATGKTVLYRSHILDVVERVCDRVLIIDEGYLVADGSLQSLKKSTKSASLEDICRLLTKDDPSGGRVSKIISTLQS